MLGDRPPALLWFGAILAAIVGWQSFYCATATDGKLTGLFFIGAGMHWKAQDPGVFVYPGTNGYDGQIYRVIAHDPLLRGAGNELFGPRYWYRRILAPAIAAALGGGRPRAVDFWYVAVTDLVLAFGGLCFVRLASPAAGPALAAAVYLVIPAVVASTDRMVADGTMLALSVAAWWFYRGRRFGATVAALAMAVAARETALFVTAGVALAFLRRREYRRAVVTAASALPAIAWWAWIWLRTAPTPMDRQLSIPLLPQIARLFTLNPRGATAAETITLEALDAIGIACLLAAFAYFAATLWREWRGGGVDEDTAVILPMAVATTFFSGPALLSEPYHFLRHASVLLAWVSLRMMRARPVWGAAYMAAAGLPMLAYRAAALARLF